MKPNDEARMPNDECQSFSLFHSSFVIRHSSFSRSPFRHSSFVISSGFTLFELILAIALSAALLGLIGTAINLYLLRVDSSRTRVEEAQLARSILAMIADDIRSTSIYLPQDTSAIAGLMASRPSGDDDEGGRDESDDGGGDDDGGGGGDSGDSPGGGSSGSSSTSEGGEEFDSEMPLGLSGTLVELYVDVTRLPRRNELFSTLTGYTNAPLPVQGAAAASSATALPTGVVLPSDLKTVRYFIRPGQAVDPANVAQLAIEDADPAQQTAQSLAAGGLVRQEIPRAMRVFAEQSGNSAILEAGQALVAPEVVHIEFRYYDGQQVVDGWNMKEEQTLPMAVEVRIWLADTSASAGMATYDRASLINTAHEYRQTVYLPMSELLNFGSAGGDADEDEEDDDDDSSSSGSGGGFSQP